MSDEYIGLVISVNFTCLFIVLFVLFGPEIGSIDFGIIDLWYGTIGILPEWVIYVFAGFLLLPLVMRYAPDIYYSFKPEKEVSEV